MNSLRKFSPLFLSFLWVSSAIAANTISGTAHNGTTGKPAVGDAVVLIRLQQGMQEEGRTKSGAQGQFTLTVTVANAQHFVRVIHQGVNYDQTVSGTGQLQITVYDAVARIPGLNGNIGIAKIESDGRVLKVTEMYAITNTSNPPVTQARPDNYEITLPPQAAIDSVEVRRGQGIWVKVAPDPVKGQERKYGVNFPIRPGDTLFKFAYHLPDRGRTTLHLRLPYPILRFGVMHPPSVRFKALRPETFKSPGLAGGLMVEAAVTTPLVGDVPAFEISGAGKTPERGAEATMAPQPRAAAASNPPASQAAASPDLANQSRRNLWLMVGGTVITLAMAGFAVLRMKRRIVPAPVSKGAGGRGPLLEALKEELFQLESDRLHGSISAEEYAATKDALNQSIQRALSRNQ